MQKALRTKERLQCMLTISPFLLSAVPPALLLAGLNAYNLWNEHWEHWSHMPPLEERVEYPYQNIRTRNFPWGDGDKACSRVPIRLFGKRELLSSIVSLR
jgi:hypothetical protein